MAAHPVIVASGPRVHAARREWREDRFVARFALFHHVVKDELVLHHVVKEGEPSDEAVLSPLAAGCVHSRPGGHDDGVRSHSKASRVHTLALARWQRG